MEIHVTAHWWHMLGVRDWLLPVNMGIQDIADWVFAHTDYYGDYPNYLDIQWNYPAPSVIQYHLGKDYQSSD